MSEDTMRLREELSEQMRALQELKQMAASHGFDISKPATNAQVFPMVILCLSCSN